MIEGMKDSEGVILVIAAHSKAMGNLMQAVAGKDSKAIAAMWAEAKRTWKEVRRLQEELAGESD